MTKNRVVLVLAVTWFAAGGLRAAPPVQFQVWGSHGPKEPAPKAGWTEIGPAVRLLPEWTAAPEEAAARLYGRPHRSVGNG